jgi:hypothetical protein
MCLTLPPSKTSWIVLLRNGGAIDKLSVFFLDNQIP